MTRSPRRIESSGNALFKNLRRALSGRGVRKTGSALVSGPKTVREVLADLPQACEAWISTDDHGAPPSDLPEHIAWYSLSRRLFRLVDIFGTDDPLLLMRTPEIKAWRPEGGLGPGCTLLVPFQDPENVGAVVRTAVAFGVRDIVLLAGSASAYHPKAIRASGGAVFRVRPVAGPPIDRLPADMPIVALSGEGRDVATVTLPDRFGLLPGLEGPGLPDRFRDRSVAVPISGPVESLNAATATAVVLYVWASRKGSQVPSDSRLGGPRGS